MTMVIDLEIILLITAFFIVISTGLSLCFIAERFFLFGKCDSAVPYYSASQVMPEILPIMCFDSQFSSYSIFLIDLSPQNIEDD